MQCLGKTEWEEGEEEYYYTSRKIYQHMKYSYKRKQIAMKPYGATTSYRTYNSYHWSSISLSQHNQQNNEKIHNAISEVSKGDCIIMGDFNHGNIKWDSLQSTGVEDQRFLCLVQDNFLTQHVLEPTRAASVLDIVLSSQK